MADMWGTMDGLDNQGTGYLEVNYTPGIQIGDPSQEVEEMPESFETVFVL
jgi:hypothetical protein